MNFILKPLSFLTLIIFFVLFSAHTASADTVTLSGSVKDSNGSAISGATVSVNNTNSNSTTTDSSGNYSMVIPNGVYDIQVTPPAGSEFSSAIALSQNISSNTILNFILSPAGTVILKGQIFGPQGNTLPNQTVSLIGSSGNPVAASTTDANGNYSIQTSPGTYNKLDINMSTGSGNAPSLNAPQYYDIYVTNYPLTQSTLLNIIIPAKKASIHTQDASNNAVSNVQLDAATPNDSNSDGLSIGGNITNASGNSVYSGSSISTDGSGNGDLWLLPTNSNNKYTLIANPPSGTNFQSTSIPNFVITADTNVNITLQQSVTLQGTVRGPQGNVLPNQTVSLIGSSGNPVVSTNTDTNGHYSLTVSPGTYNKLDINVSTGSGNAPSLNVPQYYDVYVPNYSIIQDKTQDITM